MFSQYDSLSTEQQQSFHKKFQKAWTQRILDYGSETNREKIEKHLSEDQSQRGYRNDEYNQAWEGFFISEFKTLQDSKNINHILKSFNNEEELSDLHSAVQQKFDELRNGPKDEFWIISVTQKIAAFKNFNEALSFMKEFGSALSDRNEETFIPRLSIFHTVMTIREFELFMQHNKNNDLDFALSHY